MSCRLATVQRACRWLPPIVSMRIRSFLYPQRKAFAEDVEFTVRAQTGSIYSGRTGDFHGYPFSVHGYNEWRDWAVAIAVCSAGDAIVEVGANVGTETVGFRDIVGASGRVLAFEPVPANLAAIENLISINGWGNLQVFPFAVSDSDGVITFALPPNQHASGVGHVICGSTSESAASIAVKSVRLDSMIDAIGSVRAIFCDAEGAETMVLRGGRELISKNRPVIVLEASSSLLARAGSSLAELQQTIRELHYQPFSIDRYRVNPVSGNAGSTACNWLCLHESDLGLAAKCSRMILRCALMPCIRGLNPICRSCR